MCISKICKVCPSSILLGSFYVTHISFEVFSRSGSLHIFCRPEICGSALAPLSIALATFACTLPHIKRIYICERKDHLDMINTIVKHEGFPLITKRVKNLIPYEVLRVLGKGKALFIKHNNLRKLELFIEDDLQSNKFCKYFPATIAGQKKSFGCRIREV